MSSPYARGEAVAVTCAFCRGTGRDQFGVMSPLATCGVCGGSGVRRLRPPLAGCAFCNGSGVFPGTRLTCTVCEGIGQVEVPAATVTCPECGGSGRASDGRYTDSPLPCITCGGLGVVADRRPRRDDS